MVRTLSVPRGLLVARAFVSYPPGSVPCANDRWRRVGATGLGHTHEHGAGVRVLFAARASRLKLATFRHNACTDTRTRISNIHLRSYTNMHPHICAHGDKYMLRKAKHIKSIL